MIARQHGFTLIDVLVGLAITSILSLTIYQILQQTTRSVRTINAMIDDYTDLAIGLEQLENDLTALTIVQIIPDTPKSDNSPAHPPTNPATIDQKQAAAAPASSDKLSTHELNDGMNEQLFFADKRENGYIATLAFITTNALPVLDTPIQQVVRVRYFLQQDPADARCYQLMRTESPFIEGRSPSRGAYTGRAQVLIPHLERIQLTCWYTKFKDQSASVAQETTWKHAPKQNRSSATSDDRQQLIPSFVEISGSCWSIQDQRSIPFRTIVQIPVAALLIAIHTKDTPLPQQVPPGSQAAATQGSQSITNSQQKATP